MKTIPSRQILLGWLVLQIVVLGGWAAIHEWQRQTAPRVLLKLRPVDPHDIMRGRYQRVAYEVEQVPQSLLEQSNVRDAVKWERGRKVWLALRKGTNDWHEAVAVHLQPPQTRDVMMQAKYDWQWQHWDQDLKRSTNLGIQVSLGMDRYFIPARHADLPTGTNHVILGEVSVTSTGNTQLERLLIDGKPY